MDWTRVAIAALLRGNPLLQPVIMSSPGSAPSSSAITRSHTPAEHEGDEADELPAKLQHLLAQVSLAHASEGVISLNRRL